MCPGSDHGGTMCLTRRTAKFTTADFGKRAGRERGHDHVLHGGPADHLLQGGREVLEYHDRLGARVLQLVLELARRVERVDVHDHVAGPQRAGQRDRVLQHVRSMIATRDPRGSPLPCSHAPNAADWRSSSA